jgi:hypothetical protein
LTADKIISPLLKAGDARLGFAGAPDRGLAPGRQQISHNIIQLLSA